MVIGLAIIWSVQLAVLAAGRGQWDNTWADSDKRFSHCPNVVVAHISNHPARRRSAELVYASEFGPVWTDWEVDLVVERSIFGTLKPGLITVASPFTPQDIAGLDTPVGTSQIYGIWPTYSLANPGGKLEPIIDGKFPLRDVAFVKAVHSGKLDDRFKKFLGSSSRDKIRAMSFLVGPTLDGADSRIPPVTHGFEPEVRGLLHDTDPRVREFAIVALDRLESGSLNQTFRTCLQDTDIRVRAAAAAVLIKRHDVYSLPITAPLLEKTLQEWYDNLLVYPIDPLFIALSALEHWDSLATVPILISELQDTRSRCLISEDPQSPPIPAIVASRRLKQLTGCDFPQDKALAKKLWNTAVNSRDVLGTLSTSLKPYEFKFSATITKSGSGCALRVKNLTNRDVWIATKPSWFRPVYYDRGNGSPAMYDHENWGSDSSAKVAKLSPGQTASYHSRRSIEDMSGHVTVRFEDLPSDPAKRGWVGDLTVDVP